MVILPGRAPQPMARQTISNGFSAWSLHLRLRLITVHGFVDNFPHSLHNSTERFVIYFFAEDIAETDQDKVELQKS